MPMRAEFGWAAEQLLLGVLPWLPAADTCPLVRQALPPVTPLSSETIDLLCRR